MKTTFCHCSVLSLYATTAGFAFALFEGPLSPFDWGARHFDVFGRNAHSLKGMIALVERYRPDAVVIDDAEATQSRRARRIRQLHAAFLRWANGRGVRVHLYSRQQIRQTFARFGAATKDDIAYIIAKQIPAFEHRRPPLRQAWMSEDARMWLFDAVALVFTFFHLDALPDGGR